MNWLAKLLRRQATEAEDQPPIGLARELEVKIDHVVSIIFQRHAQHLLSHPLEYIPPAIWGASLKEPLTDQQKDIWLIARPIVAEVVQALHSNGQNSRQRFAMGYLARGLIISKLAFVVEGSRLRAKQANGQAQPTAADSLADVITLGSA